MKDLRTVELEASEAIELLEEARQILYAWDKQRPTLLAKKPMPGLTPKETQKAWGLVDRAIARLQALTLYISMRPSEMGRKGGPKDR